MLRSWVVLVALLAATGCHRFEKKTSGQIGCPTKEIDIQNKKTHWARVTWNAECRGRTFSCEEHSGPEFSAAQVTCSEAIAETDSGGDDLGQDSTP